MAVDPSALENSPTRGTRDLLMSDNLQIVDKLKHIEHFRYTPHKCKLPLTGNSQNQWLWIHRRWKLAHPVNQGSTNVRESSSDCRQAEDALAKTDMTPKG